MWMRVTITWSCSSIYASVIYVQDTQGAKGMQGMCTDTHSKHTKQSVYVCMYVCVYVCLHVCVYVCNNGGGHSTKPHLYVHTYIRTYLHTYVKHIRT